MQGLELTLRREPAAVLVEAMLHGEIDAIVLPKDAARNERLNTLPLWDERTVVLVPERHRLAGLQAVQAAALAGEVLIAAEPPGACSSAEAQLSVEFGVRLERRHHGSESELGSLVALGLGLALAAAGMSVPAGVVALPLLEQELGHCVMLGVVAGRPMNRAASAFLKLMRARQWQNAEGTTAYAA